MRRPGSGYKNVSSANQSILFLFLSINFYVVSMFARFWKLLHTQIQNVQYFKAIGRTSSFLASWLIRPIKSIQLHQVQFISLNIAISVSIPIDKYLKIRKILGERKTENDKYFWGVKRHYLKCFYCLYSQRIC